MKKKVSLILLILLEVLILGCLAKNDKNFYIKISDKSIINGDEFQLVNKYFLFVKKDKEIEKIHRYNMDTKEKKIIFSAKRKAKIFALALHKHKKEIGFLTISENENLKAYRLNFLNKAVTNVFQIKTIINIDNVLPAISWSPDLNKLIFAYDYFPKNNKLILVDLKKRREKIILNSWFLNPTRISWDQNSKNVFFDLPIGVKKIFEDSYRNIYYREDLFQYDLTSSQLKSFGLKDMFFSEPVTVPNEKKIILVGQRQGIGRFKEYWKKDYSIDQYLPSSIYSFDLLQSKWMLLMKIEEYDSRISSLDISPSGRYLAFIWDRSNGERECYLFDLNTRNKRIVYSGRNISKIKWSISDDGLFIQTYKGPILLLNNVNYIS